MAASKPSSLLIPAHLSSLLGTPTTRQPCIFPICLTMMPVAPAAAETTNVSPFFGAAISIPKKAVSPLMPSTPRKTVSETKGIFGTLEGRLRRFIDGDVVLKGGETRDASALFVIGVARFYNFGNTNGAHNFTNRHNGKVSISDHPDAHGGDRWRDTSRARGPGRLLFSGTGD